MMVIKENNSRLIEVNFDEMLRSKCKMVCRHILLNNVLDPNVNFTNPMWFSDFLQHMSNSLTSEQCKSVFKYGVWFIYADPYDEELYELFKKR